MLDLNFKSGKNEISFKSQGYNLAAHLYILESLNVASIYPAVVISSAFNQVKEQIGAVHSKEWDKKCQEPLVSALAVAA